MTSAPKGVHIMAWSQK